MHMLKGIGDKFRKKMQSNKKGKNQWKVPSIIVIILLVAVGSYFGYGKFMGKSTSAALQTAMVTKGNIVKSIEGSGTIAAIEQYDITSLAKGEILADHFEEGQTIKKGALMYEIDTADVSNTVAKAEAAVEKSQITLKQSTDVISNLTVTAPIDGVLSTLYVAEGDNIQNNTKIAEIVNTQQMLLKVKFNANDAKKIQVGEKATVNLESSFSSLSGEVKRVGSGALVNGDGVAVSIIELVVQNPGGIIPGDQATATISGLACNAPGSFEYHEKKTMLSKAAGEVNGLRYKEGDTINKGSVLLELDSDTAKISAKQNELSLKDSKIALDSASEQLKNYNITAPISGKVIQKTSKAGDKLDSSSSTKTVMAIIADLSTLVFKISVDELDITNIKEGQTVEVTADALPGKTYAGIVDNVSIVGTASNGVTSYPVKVVIKECEGLIPGMNVNAKIVVASKENVLRVPVSAVKRGNMVTVKSSEGEAGEADKMTRPADKATPAGSPASGERQGGSRNSAQQQTNGSSAEASKAQSGQQTQGSAGSQGAQSRAGSGSTPQSTNGGTAKTNSSQASTRSSVPSGYKNVVVTIGLSDGEYVEIVSGLNEGDTVLLPTQSTTASATTTSTMPFGGGSGAMPGMGATGVRMGSGSTSPR